MLYDKEVMAILPSRDLERSTRFYTEKLGLKTSGEMEGGVMFDAGFGTHLFVYEKPEGTKADHTVAGFGVDDIESEVEDLKKRGVVFEEYDMPEIGLKTQGGIAPMGDLKSAWFRDPDGNILSLNQM